MISRFKISCHLHIYCWQHASLSLSRQQLSTWRAEPIQTDSFTK